MVEQLIPHHSISRYVTGVLIIKEYFVTSPFILPLFANGSPTLLFISSKGALLNKQSSHLILFGQTVCPEKLVVGEHFTLIAYFLKPYVLHSLFGLSARELTDDPIDVNLLTQAKAFSLQEKLLNAISTQDRITLLDQFVLNLMIRCEAESRLIQYATARIVKNPTKQSLAVVQNELNLSERTLQRMFEQKIGVTPNQYRRICQFNAAFEQLNKRMFNSLAEIAYANGYADQSHYTRAFREFTNMTPNEYLNFGPPE